MYDDDKFFRLLFAFLLLIISIPLTSWASFTGIAIYYGWLTGGYGMPILVYIVSIVLLTISSQSIKDN